MIYGMRCRQKLLPAIPLVVSLAAFLSESTPLMARDAIDGSPGDQSTGVLRVRVYSFRGLSPWMLRAAETEATRMLRPVAIQLNWTDCSSRAVSAPCLLSGQSTDLIVRFLAEALPKASPSALGIAGSSGEGAVAFIFYDRLRAMRTHGRLLPLMLGRVMAHEITHLLLPEEDHSDLGLMRGQWATDDLRITSSACLGLPLRSVELMQREVLRRALARTAR